MFKRIALSLALLTISVTGFSQESKTINLPVDIKIVALEQIDNFAIQNDTLTIHSVTLDLGSSKGYRYYLNLSDKSGNTTQIDCSKGSIDMKLPEINSLEDYWQFKNIQSLFTLSKSRSLGKIRVSAEQNVLSVYEQLKPKIFEDAFLTDYLYGLFMKIYMRNNRPDSFNYDFSIFVIDELEPVAYIYSNGFLTISTGMLASLHTEDELVAVLARECNHFISNHNFQNMTKAAKKMSIAAGVDLVSAVFGAKGNAMKLTESIIALGFNFDKSQETDSDTTAVHVLSLLGYDPNGLATALTNMSKYYIEEGTLEQIYSPQGRFPSLEDRISATGVPYSRKDIDYEERVAGCVSAVAKARFSQGKSALTISILQENIDNNLASPSDYCLYGTSLMKIQDNDDNSWKAIDAFQKSLDGNLENIDAYKGLVMAYSRLKMYEDALRALQDLRAIAGDNTSILSWIENTSRTISRKMSAGAKR